MRFFLTTSILLGTLLVSACDGGETNNAGGGGNGGTPMTGGSMTGGGGNGGTPMTGGGGDGGAANGGGGAGGSANGGGGAGGAPNADLDSFTQTAATAICGALYRCCNTISTEVYFLGPASSPDLEAFKEQIPPAKMFADEAECQATLKAMLDITPFGDWVTEAKAGTVEYDPAAFQACVTTLDTAACGADVMAALYDSTCLGFAAPAGGKQQRSMFSRTGVEGAPCVPIFDGTGARLYGTCDPTQAFCCYENPASPGFCAGAVDANGNKRTGTCKAVSPTGGACYVNVNPVDFQLCATGSECGFTSEMCIEPGTGPLQTGDPCLDLTEYVTLGDCKNSYCDTFGNGQCVALKADGAACSAAFECMSGGCNCPDPLDYQCALAERKCGAPADYCAMP